MKGTSTFVQLIDLTAGLMLVAAFVVLWRRSLTAVVRALAVQGVALAGVAAVVGLHRHEAEPVLIAALIMVFKGGVVPMLLSGIVQADEDARELDPLVNVSASLIAGALLTLVAYAVTRDVVALAPTPEIQALPIGVAVVLVGLFVLVTRRKAVMQIVGFLLLDNGIALVALLATSGVPLLVELGVTLDMLLVVLILQVLTARMRRTFGTMDLDDLQELRD